MADASSSGPQAISGLGEDIGRFVAWKSSPGGLVQTARGPRGERLTLTHDKCGRVVERRVERDGFRAKVWRYEWDAFDRLIRCVTPEREAWRYGYDPFGRRVWKVKEFTEAEARSYVGKFPKLIDAARLPDRGATLAEHKRSRLDEAKRAEGDAPPIVGVHFLWDGDVLAEETPLRLDGAVDWDRATRWHYEPGTFRPLAKETPEGELLHIVTDHLGTPREMVPPQARRASASSCPRFGAQHADELAILDHKTHSGQNHPAAVLIETHPKAIAFTKRRRKAPCRARRADPSSTSDSWSPPARFRKRPRPEFSGPWRCRPVASRRARSPARYRA
jgi:YD repeat-containing protein